MKIRIVLLLSLFIASRSYAADAKITIKQKSGNETILELSTNPIITFQGEEMVVNSDLARISIPIADIDSYTVSDGTADIKDIVVTTQYVNGRVVLQGLPRRTVVHVFSMSGRTVFTQYADDTGRSEISLEMLPVGVYIVSAFNTSVKIINK